MTAFLLGIDRIGFSAVTNFGSGLASSHQDLSGEGHLIAAQKALAGLGDTIFKMVEKYAFKDNHRID